MVIRDIKLETFMRAEANSRPDEYRALNRNSMHNFHEDVNGIRDVIQRYRNM